VVTAIWKLQRLTRAETALLHSRVQALKADRFAIEVRSFESTFTDFQLPTVITDEVAHAEARAELGRANYERNRDEVLLGRAFEADAKEGEALGKLTRYERSLERSLHRDLNELRLLQDRRRNRSAPLISEHVTLVETE
jgi:hypothetical protein